MERINCGTVSRRGCYLIVESSADGLVSTSFQCGLGCRAVIRGWRNFDWVPTQAGGIPDVIEHGVNGLLAPVDDPTGLGDNIVRLLTDRAMATRLAANAKARAPDFSVERMTDRTIDIYERVLARSPLDSPEDVHRRAEAPSAARSASSTRAP